MFIKIDFISLRRGWKGTMVIVFCRPLARNYRVHVDWGSSHVTCLSHESFTNNLFNLVVNIIGERYVVPCQRVKFFESRFVFLFLFIHFLLCYILYLLLISSKEPFLETLGSEFLTHSHSLHFFPSFKRTSFRTPVLPRKFFESTVTLFFHVSLTFTTRPGTFDTTP